MPVIVVTGGGGFIGSAFVKKLNNQGYKNIVIIDCCSEQKLHNLLLCSFIDLISYEIGLQNIEEKLNKYSVEAIFHIGANTDVLSKNRDEMMEVNYLHSIFYFNYSMKKRIAFMYVSSSAVYGNCYPNQVDNYDLKPLNDYSLSKWLFDQYFLSNFQVFQGYAVGFRLFNVFGMGEFHKGANASIPYRFFQFINTSKCIKIFDREIFRDYVWVEDVTNILLHVFETRGLKNGIYNLGSGEPVAHKEIADLVINAFVDKGIYKPSECLIDYVSIPESLESSFQLFTRAEGIVETIQSRTGRNREKMKLYINNLIELTHLSSI